MKPGTLLMALPITAIFLLSGYVFLLAAGHDAKAVAGRDRTARAAVAAPSASVAGPPGSVAAPSAPAAPPSAPSAAVTPGAPAGTAGTATAVAPPPSPTSTASGSGDGPDAGPDARSDTGSAGRAETVRVPYSAKGRYKVVKGVAEPPEGTRGKVVRYLVEVERGLPFDAEDFAAMVHRTLNDPRSWGRGRMRFERVDHGPVRFRVALSSPALTNVRCRPLQTFGELSCWNGRRSVINAKRWGAAIPGYHGDLVAYRQYVINHEVGHALGHAHQQCPAPGGLAPVMTQQTKSLQGCRPNAWPFPRSKGGSGGAKHHDERRHRTPKGDTSDRRSKGNSPDDDRPRAGESGHPGRGRDS
ncbi:DUF3152 domain-containing protein [Sphaerisporangium sp. NPDC005289]|uniref:DUF3152 domain-containing protein n=1 Tax=Sphaerisporangium sp. NPDC005289 TaxID=3155247 RepID=UPI0033AF6969